MKTKISPGLARMLESVEVFREELTNYGESLESSTVSSEQTYSYEVASNVVNSLESALKALAYDEVQRTT